MAKHAIRQHTTVCHTVVIPLATLVGSVSLVTTIGPLAMTVTGAAAGAVATVASGAAATAAGEPGASASRCLRRRRLAVSWAM